MERRMRGNVHVRCGAGEKLETVSKTYLSLSLNQRGTIGWKAMRLAKRLIESYMVRIETGCATMPTLAASN